MAVKVGILGTGGIAFHHLAKLGQIEGVELRAYCDVVEERAKLAAAQYGGRGYVDFKRMLGSEDLDALWVCLPPFAHGEEEILAAERGIHLFVEKPVALTLEQAKAIDGAVKKSGIIASVGYAWRYLGSVERAKGILRDKTIAMVLGYWMDGMPGTAWWRVQSKSGGQIVEQTTHVFDLARYLAGEVKRVYASYALVALQGVPNFDISDIGTVNLEFVSGAIGNVTNTCMLSQGYLTKLAVVCKDLVLEIEGNKLRLLEPGNIQVSRMEEMVSSVDTFRLEDQIFIDAVRTGDTSKIKSTYEDGVKSLAVSLAANESAGCGEPVEVVY